MDALIIQSAISIAVLVLIWVVIWLLERRYKRELNELYNDRKNILRELKNPLPVDCDELSCRVDELLSPQSGVKKRRLLIKTSPRDILVIVTDGRERFLEKLGLYDEQCNNFILMIKQDLELNGMS